MDEFLTFTVEGLDEDFCESLTVCFPDYVPDHFVADFYYCD